MKVILALSLIVVIGVSVGGSWWHEEPSAEDIIADMERFGIDVYRPRGFDFYINFRNEAPASEACDFVKARGYAVSIEHNDNGTVTCAASKLLIPNRENIQSEASFFERVAEQHDGEYGDYSVKTNLLIE
jgi:hypothetical protein